MARTLALVTALAVALTASASDAAAQSCRDAKGKFIKCPPPAATKCRDKTTKKFAKCSAPNTEPVPTKKP